MKDSTEQRIQNQFSSFCTTVLKNEAKLIEREYAHRRNHEKSLSEITAPEEGKTAVWDKYFMDETVFDVLGLPVVVTGNLLAEAISRLSQAKRDIILLFYFLGMTDREIAEHMHILHHTISKRRYASLKELRTYLSKEGMEWQDI